MIELLRKKNKLKKIKTHPLSLPHLGLFKKLIDLGACQKNFSSRVRLNRTNHELD